MTSHASAAVTWVAQLESTLESFDEAGGHRVLGQAFERLGVEDALVEVVLPYLHHLGCRWEQGHIGVAQEHFASTVIRLRLVMLLHGEQRATGPLAVLACMPGELHEFGLMTLALVLARRGWNICYLGANTPTTGIALTVRTLRPQAVVLSAHRRTSFAAHGPALRRLAEVSPIHIAGPGATAEVARLCESRLVVGNPVDGAGALHAAFAAAEAQGIVGPGTTLVGADEGG